MKNLGMLMLLVAGSSANAGVILHCSTPGEALGSVEMIENNDNTGSLMVTDSAGEEESWQLITSLKTVKAGGADTLVAAKNTNVLSGGGVADAATISVLPGQKTARLAANKFVYFLNCSK